MINVNTMVGMTPGSGVSNPDDDDDEVDVLLMRSVC